MVIKILHYSCLGLVCCLLMACPRPCSPPEIIFEVSLLISPEKRTYHIMDTLWLSTQFSISIKDVKGGALVDFTDASYFGAELGFIGLEQGGRNIQSANSFAFIERIGQIIIPEGSSESYQKTLRKTLFAEINKHYELNIGIIPKEKGIFTIGANYSPAVKRKNAGKCDSPARVNYKYRVVNNNFDIYKQFNPRAIDSKNFYTFIVE